MNRFAAIIFLVLLLAPAGWAQRHSRRHSSPPPHLVMEQLSRMSPEQRERLLEELPPRRRAIVERRLQRYRRLPPEHKARLRREFNAFDQLPPEQKQELRSLYRQFSELPPPRRRIVQRELQRLRTLPADDAAARMQSDPFRSAFSDSERQMLERLAALLPRREPKSR